MCLSKCTSFKMAAMDLERIYWMEKTIGWIFQKCGWSIMVFNYACSLFSKQRNIADCYFHFTSFLFTSGLFFEKAIQLIHPNKHTYIRVSHFICLTNFFLPVSFLSILFTPNQEKRKTNLFRDWFSTFIYLFKYST